MIQRGVAAIAQEGPQLCSTSLLLDDQIEVGKMMQGLGNSETVVLTEASHPKYPHSLIFFGSLSNGPTCILFAYQFNNIALSCPLVGNKQFVGEHGQTSLANAPVLNRQISNRLVIGEHGSKPAAEVRIKKFLRQRDTHGAHCEYRQDKQKKETRMCAAGVGNGYQLRQVMCGRELIQQRVQAWMG